MDSKQEYTGQTIAQLNDIRKGLLLELRDLRKRQADALDKVYLEVVKDQEDIAETYFTSGNEANGKFFSQRLDNCMRALVKFNLYLTTSSCDIVLIIFISAYYM